MAKRIAIMYNTGLNVDELAQSLRSLGCEVMITELGNRLLAQHSARPFNGVIFVDWHEHYPMIAYRQEFSPRYPDTPCVILGVDYTEAGINSLRSEGIQAAHFGATNASEVLSMLGLT